MSAAIRTTAPGTHDLPAALDIRANPDALAALWKMSSEQRVDAMWRGELTLYQCTKWSGQRPDEVPTLGGEFAYLMVHTPEWADAADQHRQNVVHLPERSQHRAAA